MVAETHASSIVPFLDLARIHEPLAADVLEDIEALFDSGAFTNGPDVKRFETAFAEYCGRAQCVGVGSGLDGLRLALQALGVGRDDEVIVPAQTFVATWEAVSQVGGVPVPVDVSEVDYNMDPSAVEAAIGPRTAAILPVDLYGQLADMPTLRAIAAGRGLSIVEDACQAHGARRDGAGPGAHADACAFSFYPGKNLGAAGDAGAVVTDDAELAASVRLLREHGQRAKYAHEAIGWTSRLDTIQAAVLARKLPHLDGWNRERREIARQYREALAGVGDLRLPPVAPASEPVWHLFVVLTRRPDDLIASLADRGVRAGRHYPQPPHLTDAYRSLGHRPGSFPVAEHVAAGCVSLPIFPGMTEQEVERVIAAVTESFGHRDGGRAG